MNGSEEKDKKDIVKGAGVNFLGFLVRLSSRLPFMFLVVALHGNDLYGRYIFTITIVELGAALSVFGFKRSLFKFIQDDKYNEGHSAEEIVVAALICSFVVGLLLIGGILLSVDSLARFFDYPEMVAGLTRLVPIILAISMVDILLTGTRVSRQMKYEMIARSFVEPYVLLFVMLGLYFLGLGAAGLLLAYTASIFAALAIAIWGSSRIFSFGNFLSARPSLRMIWKISRFSTPTAFHDLALLVFMRMDILTVKFFFAEGVLGIYNIAQQITTSVEKIYQSFYPILAPVMSKNLLEKDIRIVERQMIMVSRWTLMVQCVLVVVAIFYGQAFMTLIAAAGTGQTILASGAVVLTFLMIGETINGGFGMTDMPILFRYPIFNPVISVIMILLYVAIVKFFVEYLETGVEGVAMALCSIYLLMNMVRVITLRKLMGINMLHMSLLRVVIAAGGSVLIFEVVLHYLPLNLLEGYGIAVGIPLVMIIYSLSIIGFCLTPGDKAKLFRWSGLKK